MHLAQDSDQWRAVVNKASDHKMRGISRLAEGLLASVPWG